MRDINKLTTRTKIERAWMANKSVMIHKPKSTLEAKQRVVIIFNAKYEIEIADLCAVVKDNCNYLRIPNQGKLLKLLTEFKDLFDGALGDWDTELVSLKLKEGPKPYHGGLFQLENSTRKPPKKRLRGYVSEGY